MENEWKCADRAGWLGGETDDDEEEDKNDVDPWWQPKPD